MTDFSIESQDDGKWAVFVDGKKVFTNQYVPVIADVSPDLLTVCCLEPTLMGFAGSRWFQYRVALPSLSTEKTMI